MVRYGVMVMGMRLIVVVRYGSGNGSAKIVWAVRYSSGNGSYGTGGNGRGVEARRCYW